MPDMPRLDDLSFDQLCELQLAIGMLAGFGQTMLDDGGPAPTFSLVPGHQMIMKLPSRMPLPGPMGAVVSTPWVPPAGPVFTGIDLASDDDETVLDLRGPEDFPADRVEPFTPQTDIEDMLDDVMRTVRLDAPLTPVPPPAPRLQPQPDVEAAAAAAVTAVVGHDPAPQPSHAPKMGKPAAWTGVEDDMLISLVAEGIVHLGMTKTAAVQRAAERLVRPVEGTKFHLHTKLADRLAEASATLEAQHKAQKPAAPHPPVDATGSIGGMAAAPAAPYPAPPAQDALSPIEKHLMSLPRKGGWSMERDFTLLDLACLGWQMPEIAAEMGLDAGAVKARFDLLTKLDTDTKRRTFTRSALREALEPWVAQANTAAAE